MLIYSFITDYQAFSLRYKDNTTRDKNETKVGKQSANLGKNNEPIQNRLSFLIDCKSVILHHLTILSFPMVRPVWDNWWLLTNRYYKKNENCFTGRTATDSLRMAGVGGVNVVKTIPVSWTFTLAGEQYTETNIPVVTSSEQNEEYDCRIGLPTLMAHRKFIINFKNMWMRFED